MPLQSPPRKVSETENMLRLLLSVDALDSVTAAQLWMFAAELELMDYVTMRLCLHKLLAAGELETGEGALQEQLFLTDRGREALALFGTRLPKDVWNRVCGAAPAFRDRVANNRQVRAAYEMARPGEYRLNLSVHEGDLPTVLLQLHTTNRDVAGRAIHRFAAHAAEVTTYLYTLAERAVQTPPADRDAPPQASEAVTGHSANEYSARVTLPGRKAVFDVALLLPVRQAAEAFVRLLSQPEESAQAAAKLLEMITAPVRKGK